MESTVTSDGEPIGAAGRGVEQNQRAYDDLRADVLLCFTCPAITVGTVILRALDRVRGRYAVELLPAKMRVSMCICLRFCLQRGPTQVMKSTDAADIRME